jgi:hypothetical protein
MRKLMRSQTEKTSGQSFVELALAIPLILILLAGVVEVAFFIFTYLNLLDLTREAARFASARDYRKSDISDPSGLPLSACTDDELHFYYDTACFFIDEDLNPYIPLSESNFDDVTISVFVVNNDTISQRYPIAEGGVWSLFNNNWQKDCEGSTVASEPTYTNADIQSLFVSGAPGDRGLVLVEAFMCYDLVMNLPIISDFTPSPFRLHAYSMMPAPDAIPTPTPIGP